MVAISLLTLVPGELGGTETYVRELTRALAEGGTLSYKVLCPPVAPGAGNGLPSEVVEEYGEARSLPGRFAVMARAGVLPRRIRRRFAGAGLVHFPLTVPLPEPWRQPYAITLHDVLHRDQPRLFPRWEGALRRAAYDRPARRAAAVIVPSAFTGSRAVARLGVRPERVHVVPHGIDHAGLRPGEGEREPFLLYPARAWPHKNHARLFRAFGLLRRRRPGLRLVLTGGGDHGALPEGVEARGIVPREELVFLMQRASALVFPSVYEGFGAPPLEAMACGCPVACSRAASLPEVCGDAAVLFDPTSPDEIAAAVERALDDADRLRELGLERAARYTWAASAHGHEEAYRAAGAA